MKLREFSLAIFIAAGSLRAQVGIGTKTPRGVLHMKTQTKNAQGENIQAALVLPTPDKAENVKNIQGGQPAPGSLVFDQNKQCLRYFYLTRTNDPDSGQWSECSGKDNGDKMMSHEVFNFTKNDFINHRTCGKDFVYRVIKSDKTKRKWLDRNIGASRVAEHKNDRFAVGSLYQWGRESDGHECRESKAKSGSETTYTRSTSDRPLHYKFIASGYYDYDNKWQVNPNKNLWKMPEKLNNPCPAGFHVPSRKEWEVELIGFDSDDDAFNSPLKLVRWGFRDSLARYSDWAYAYWSSDFAYMVSDGYNSHPIIQFSDDPNGRSIDGMSIRCIADE